MFFFSSNVFPYKDLICSKQTKNNNSYFSLTGVNENFIDTQRPCWETLLTFFYLLTNIFLVKRVLSNFD